METDGALQHIKDRSQEANYQKEEEEEKKGRKPRKVARKATYVQIQV